MRQFLVTAEMKADAEADRQEMLRLRDEMERAGFVFKDFESFGLRYPFEVQRLPDGDMIFRQWENQ